MSDLSPLDKEIEEEGTGIRDVIVGTAVLALKVPWLMFVAPALILIRGIKKIITNDEVFKDESKTGNRKRSTPPRRDYRA